MYLTILSDVFKENDEDRNKGRIKINQQIEALDSRINVLNDKFIDGEIDQPTYKDTKKRYESTKSELVSKHILIKPEGTAIKNYLFFALSLSKNLSKFYKMADMEIKQQIIGSIFPGNLIFEDKIYRTNRLNEAFSLLVSPDKEYKQGPMKKAGIFADLSTLAPPSGRGIC